MFKRRLLRDKFGCLTCRRRRKKCDYRLPRCGDCARLGFHCEWPKANRAQALLETSKLAQSPSLNGQQTEICTSLLVYKCREAERSDLGLNIPDGVHSIPVLLDLFNESMSTTWACFEACAMGFFSRVNNLPSLRHESLRRYGHCLSEVNSMLAKPSPSSLELTLSAIFLGLFESLSYGSLGAWVNHYLGIGQFFQYHGVEVFCKLPHLLILEFCRPRMIFASIARRQRTFLDTPEWRDMPWKSIGYAKPWSQKLFDIIGQISAALEDLDRCVTHASDRGQISESKAEFNTILEQLHLWRLRYDKVHGRLVPEIAPVLQTFGGKLMRVQVTFTNMHQAAEMLWYNNALLIVCEALETAQGLFDRHLPLHSNISRAEIPYESDLIVDEDLHTKIYRIRRQSALEISKAVEIFVTPQNYDIGAQFIIRPALVALRFLGASTESERLQSILDSVTTHLKFTSEGKQMKRLCGIAC